LDDFSEDDLVCPDVATFSDVVKPKPGKTLIVGSHIYGGRADRRDFHDDAIGLDMIAGEGVDLVWDLENPLDMKFDHIECCSVLEHAKRPWLVAQNIEAMMSKGSTLHLAVPFIWRPHAYPNDYWRFTTEAIRLIFPAIKWKYLTYAHKKLQSEGKLPSVKVKEYPYFARTEVYGFGTR